MRERLIGPVPDLGLSFILFMKRDSLVYIYSLACHFLSRNWSLGVSNLGHSIAFSNPTNFLIGFQGTKFSMKFSWKTFKKDEPIKLRRKGSMDSCDVTDSRNVFKGLRKSLFGEVHLDLLWTTCSAKLTFCMLQTLSYFIKTLN